jgi:NADH:ubiquinone reductase (H+-translocating)
MNDICQSSAGNGSRDAEVKRRPTILILGGGFAGVEVARELEKLLSPDEAIIQLVSRDNFVLFTPMLHEIAASDLDISTVANPIRKMIRRTQFIVADVESLDTDSKSVKVIHGFDRRNHTLKYDHLVLALGSVPNFHGMVGLEHRALTMKSLEDAILLRNRMIAHLEEADPDYSVSSRNGLLTMVVAGGGFAGVETVAGIHDFMHSAIRSYSNLHPLQIRVVLVHPGTHLLPELGEQLGRFAEKKLRERGIEVLTQRRLSSITDAGVTLDDGVFIGTSFVVWTAGNSPSPVVAALPFANRGGRIDTNRMLQVEMKTGVWALGDCASIPDGNGGFHPPTAQHALRQARTAASNIVASIRGDALRPFSFKTIGQLAAIGHRTGVGRIFGRRFSGFIAWWMWRTIYLSKLPGLEKRLRVALDWTLDLVFAKDTVQYTSFRAFSQSTQSSPFHDPARSPRDSEPDPPTPIGVGLGGSTIGKVEPID